jgi:hypothetical protein
LKKESLQKEEWGLKSKETQTILPFPQEVPQTIETVLTVQEPYPLELLRERLAAYEERMAEQRNQWDAEKEERRRLIKASEEIHFAPIITTASADSLRESVAEVEPTE